MENHRAFLGGARAAAAILMMTIAAVGMAPTAAADCNGTNNGVIVAVLGDVRPCGGGSGDCTNNGVLVTVIGSFDCGSCENNGVFVGADSGCLGERGFMGLNACVSDDCYLNSN